MIFGFKSKLLGLNLHSTAVKGRCVFQVLCWAGLCTSVKATNFYKPIMYTHVANTILLCILGNSVLLKIGFECLIQGNSVRTSLGQCLTITNMANAAHSLVQSLSGCTGE